MQNVRFRTDINALDFEPQKVILQHQDGTRCEFAWAFVEKEHIKVGAENTTLIIKVYTEHNGNYLFYANDLVYYRTEPTIYPSNLKQKIKKMLEYWKSLSAKF